MQPLKLEIRKWHTFVDEIQAPACEDPLRKIAVVAVIGNPFAGRYVEDLKPLIDASAELGRQMAERAIVAMQPFKGVGLGKGGIAGMNGEQEHVNALLTSTFAEPLRKALGGGKAWVSSMTKRGAPGTSIDIPFNHKDALYVRSFYDGITLTLHDAPAPDEIALIFGMANRGRVGARVGGLRPEDVKGEDGLY
jgi:hypothetical protein